MGHRFTAVAFAAMVTLGAGAAQAASLNTVTAFDPLNTEIAVGELRAGLNGAERELGINTPTGATVAQGSVTSGVNSKGDPRQILLPDGTYSFTFGVTNGILELALSGSGIDPLSISSGAFDLSNADGIFLRAYGGQKKIKQNGQVVGIAHDHTTTLSNLMFDSTPFTGQTLTSTGGTQALAEITGVDLTGDWLLSGDITYDGIDEGGRRSNLAAQFKIFDDNLSSVSEIPLPAAGWLLIAGLGGLAAMRRRA